MNCPYNMSDRKPLYGHTSHTVPASGLISPACIAIVTGLEVFRLAGELQISTTDGSNRDSVATKVSAAEDIGRKLQSGVELVDGEFRRAATCAAK
jgi:hypothetical protein